MSNLGYGGLLKGISPHCRSHEGMGIDAPKVRPTIFLNR
jgi:hypothetical protein